MKIVGTQITFLRIFCEIVTTGYNPSGTSVRTGTTSPYTGEAWVRCSRADPGAAKRSPVAPQAQCL